MQRQKQKNISNFLLPSKNTYKNEKNKNYYQVLCTFFYKKAWIDTNSFGTHFLMTGYF